MGDVISTIEDAKHATYYGTADTVLSIIAGAMLFALYASPVPAFWRMFKKGSTEMFHPYTYLIAYANCGLWVIYASSLWQPEISTPFYSLCLRLSNEFGCVFAISYAATFLYLPTKMNKGIIVLFFLVACLPVIILIFTANFETHRLGPACVVYGILMYASPLSVIGTVYRTKSVEYLPFWLCMACFLNGVVWVIYSCVSRAPLDIYIVITNSVGMLLGLFQLLVYYKFHVNSQNLCTVHPEGIETI